MFTVVLFLPPKKKQTKGLSVREWNKINEVLYSKENEGTIATRRNIDNSHKYSAELRNPDTQENKLYTVHLKVQYR